MSRSFNVSKLATTLQRRASVIAYGLCLVVVGAWTLLRFFSQSSTYDLVTQQAVARSWLHGNFGQVDLGITHYLLKVFFLYMPLDILPGSPRRKLIFLALLINLASFVLLIIVLRKILAEFSIRQERYLSGAMLWLGLIAGSVFWMQFANSRNLEVVGGMFLIYACLKFLRLPSWRLGIGLCLFSAALFFSDTLQIYMTALPFLVYGAVLSAKKRDWQKYIQLIGLLLLGFFGSRLLFWLAAHILNINFTGAGVAVSYTASQLIHSVPQSLKALMVLFSGTTSGGKFHEAVNITFIACAAIAFLVGVYRRAIPRRLGLLVGVYFLFNWLVYMVSGQAINTNTQRYLIMLAPISVLAIASLAKLKIDRRLIYSGLALLIGFNLTTLGYALIRNWNINFPQDAHIQSIARYAKGHNASIVYGSMDSALPLIYYKSAPKTNFIPLACASPRLITAHSLPAATKPRSGQALLILDRSSINNVPNICTQDMILQQLGAPLAYDKTDDNSSVLVYSASTLAVIP